MIKPTDTAEAVCQQISQSALESTSHCNARSTIAARVSRSASRLLSRPEELFLNASHDACVSRSASRLLSRHQRIVQTRLPPACVSRSASRLLSRRRRAWGRSPSFRSCQQISQSALESTSITRGWWNWPFGVSRSASRLLSRLGGRDLVDMQARCQQISQSALESTDEQYSEMRLVRVSADQPVGS